VLVALGLSLTFLLPQGHEAPDRAAPVSSLPSPRPAVGHVFVINIENKGFGQTWGRYSQAPYLAKTLRARGVLLSRYYGTAHRSLGNYTAQISGQGPSAAIQDDCLRYTAFHRTRGTVAPGQVVGRGCVYPASVGTLPRQLTAAGLGWKGYMEDMAVPCQHPRLGASERWGSASRRQQYATRHNPFMYFRSITGRPSYCRQHVVALSHLRDDLRRRSTTPALSYITPDLCHDGHDATCADGGPGGLEGVNRWMRTWVPRILQSPAYQHDGMLVITADESDGVSEDSSACCGEGPGPNAARPGIDGMGGGRIGALVLSRYVVPGAVSARGYNHYSLLGSLEDLFGLPRLGYARTVPRTFGTDVFGAG
jgi:phosphatidylinositol-3-phosphatase